MMANEHWKTIGMTSLAPGMHVYVHPDLPRPVVALLHQHHRENPERERVVPGYLDMNVEVQPVPELTGMVAMESPWAPAESAPPAAQEPESLILPAPAGLTATSKDGDSLPIVAFEVCAPGNANSLVPLVLSSSGSVGRLLADAETVSADWIADPE